MSDNVKDFETGKDKPSAPAGKKRVGEALDKARDKFSDVAGEVEKRVKGLGEGASKATQQVKEQAERASAAAKESYDAAREKVKYGYEKARKDFDHLVADVNQYTRDNPGKAVLIAASVGFVLGLLMRPRRD